jgi:hypothetical protein
MTTYDEIMQEIKQEISNGQTLEEVKERSHEIVDGYIPIYNNRVLEEWQNMPNDYDNRGAAELGHNCQEIDIISLMQADLYLYYSDIVAAALYDLDQELESAGE